MWYIIKVTKKKNTNPVRIVCDLIISTYLDLLRCKIVIID